MAANLVLLSDKPHYCDRCWAITSLDVLKELLFQDGYRLCSRQELIDSASSGCLFCNKLATISLHFQYKQVSLRISPFWTRKEELIAARNVEELFVGGLLHQLRVVFGDHTYALSSTMIWNLDAFTTKDDPCAPFVSRHFSTESIPSDMTPCQLQSYWDECETSHPECKNFFSNQELAMLPTRVLDISSVERSSEVKLYITKEKEQSKYIALSYCWGGPQHLTTTIKTLPERQSGIPLSSLPRTILDAIRVTQQLGFRYLWVDSLCIIQDSPEDKRREIAIMGEVYKNAAITVAAGNAKAVEEGFLSERPAAAFDACPLPFRLSDNQLGTVYFKDARQPFAPEPILFSRGWAFQEFLLSPRVILYDRFGVNWNCSTTSFGGLPDMVSYKPSHKLSFSNSIQQLRFNNAMSRKHTNSGWSNLISEYSARDFTCFEDRLPAIAGIAREFSLLLNDEYVAGLWRGELTWTLGWQKQELFFAPAVRPFQNVRHQRIGSPSWSWKTAPFPINMPWWHGAHYTPSVEVYGCKVKLLSEDSPFGDVVEGTLALRAKVLPVSALTSAHSRDGIRLDYSDNKLDSSVYVLLLGIWNKERDPEGLVVRKSKEGSFERIGFFRDRSGDGWRWESTISQVVILK